MADDSDPENTTYSLTSGDHIAIELAFSTNPNPTPDQVGRITEIREVLKETARKLHHLCPRGRSLAVAMTHLETAGMFAVKAVAHETVPTRRDLGDPITAAPVQPFPGPRP